MNIHDITSKAAVEAPSPRPKGGTTAKPAAHHTSAAADSFKPEHLERYLQALGNEPDIRPEVLERAKQFVEDPNYPPESILLRVADELIPPTQR